MGTRPCGCSCACVADLDLAWQAIVIAVRRSGWYQEYVDVNGNVRICIERTPVIAKIWAEGCAKASAAVEAELSGRGPRRAQLCSLGTV